MSTTLVENGWVCGDNSHGQLGVASGTYTTSSSTGTHSNASHIVGRPTPLSSQRWKAMSVGHRHSAGVGDGGEVYTWGNNDQGQLGAPGGPKAGMWDVPRRVELLYGWDVQGVACGADHTVAMTPHDVITWGSNCHGQCGHGERAETDWVKPRSLKLLHGQMVTQVVCGAHHTLCVTATSLVFAWGDNSYGQLGVGDVRNRKSPALVNGLWALPVRQLAAGVNHSAALTSNGFLFTWGDGRRGQLGLPLSTEEATMAAMSRTASERRRHARRVNQRFVQTMLDMGIPEEQAALALMETGNVGVEVAAEWLFSVPPDVLESHLSFDDVLDSPSASLDAVVSSVHHSGVVTIPRRVPLQKVRAVAAGGNHMLACSDNEVYSWGCNEYGQLGVGSFVDEKHPQLVTCLDRHGITQLAAGSRHSVFLSVDGSVYACGEIQGLVPGHDESEDEYEDNAYDVQELFCRDDDDDVVSLQQRFETSTMMRELPCPSRSVDSTICSIPVLVPLDFLKNAHSNNSSERRDVATAVVSQVVCGDGSTVMLTRRADELPDVSPPLLRERLQAALESVVQLEESERQEYLMPICSAVEKVFGSAAAISSAFGIPDAVGLEPGLLEDIQNKVLSLEPPPAPKLGEPQPERDELHKSLRIGLESLILDIERNIKLMGTPERAQVLLAAMQSPLLGDSRCSNSLIPRVCNIILASPASCRHLLVGWWSAYDPSLLERRVVAPLQKYLTDELYATKKLTISVMNAIKVLALVEEANQLGRLLPPEAFYNELISEKLDVLDHYVAWRQTHDMPRHSTASDGPFSFCSYPFLLNPRAKSKLLHTEARIQMDQTVADARVEAQNGKRQSEDPIVPGPKLPKRSNDAKGGRGKAQHVQRRASRESRFQVQGSGATASTSHRGSLWRLFPASRQVHDDGEGNDGSNTSSGDAQEDRERSNGLWKHGSLGLPSPEESGFPATHPEMCIVRIRRCHLLEDALNEVSRQRPRDLFKPLRVHFIGEDGVDAGGVKKEFFQLLMAELLSGDYGMLIFQEETRTYWFDAGTYESDDAFFLLGLIVGLAVYNGVLLDLPLPLALYRKILGLDVKLRDLKDIQPTLGRSLEQILEYSGPGNVEDVFCQTFSIPMVKGGETREVPLCPGGDTIAVTEDNRREFVDAYVSWWLCESIERQFEAFAKGLLTLCGGPALQLFSPTELERLVCGTPCLDFEGLQKAAKYDGGFHPEHRVVRWLWAVVRTLPDDEKKSFLKFVTGSDRAPIGGLANLRVIVQRDGADSNKLPTSHTCFNTLLLPSYRSQEKLKDRLQLAILNAEGFGLE